MIVSGIAKPLPSNLWYFGGMCSELSYIREQQCSCHARTDKRAETEIRRCASDVLVLIFLATRNQKKNIYQDASCASWLMSFVLEPFKSQ